MWLNNNLGAEYNNIHSPHFNPAQQAKSSDDYLAYGSLFQWGRPADGHELRTCTDSTNCKTSARTGSLSSTIVTSNSYFVDHSGQPYDWTTADSNGKQRSYFWSKSDGTGICPIGFRVPTMEELDRIRISEGITNSSKYFLSNLKGVVSGMRRFDSALEQVGVASTLWSTTFDGTNSRSFYMNGSVVDARTSIRSYGFPVRCISEN